MTDFDYDTHPSTWTQEQWEQLLDVMDGDEPASAKASDHVRVRHVNRDPDAGKKATRRGARSLRKR